MYDISTRAGRRLTPKLSCKRPTCQAAHQYAGLSTVQPLSGNPSDVSALVSCSVTVDGGRVNYPVRTEVSRQHRTVRGSLSRAATTARTTYARRSQIQTREAR